MLFNNYRPIFLLPVFSKILDKVMYDRLYIKHFDIVDWNFMEYKVLPMIGYALIWLIEISMCVMMIQIRIYILLDVGSLRGQTSAFSCFLFMLIILHLCPLSYLQICLLMTPTFLHRTKCHTVYPKKHAHGFVVRCFVVVMQSFIINSHEVFIHIHQGCFAGTGAIVRLPQCQWSKPDGYGKISQCITTTKHSKAKTVCIFLGIYCRCHRYC